MKKIFTCLFLPKILSFLFIALLFSQEAIAQVDYAIINTARAGENLPPLTSDIHQNMSLLLWECQDGVTSSCDSLILILSQGFSKAASATMQVPDIATLNLDRAAAGLKLLTGNVSQDIVLLENECLFSAYGSCYLVGVWFTYAALLSANSQAQQTSSLPAQPTQSAPISSLPFFTGSSTYVDGFCFGGCHKDYISNQCVCDDDDDEGGIYTSGIYSTSIY